LRRACKRRVIPAIRARDFGRYWMAVHQETPCELSRAQGRMAINASVTFEEIAN
jgi:hypothetical protein